MSKSAKNFLKPTSFLIATLLSSTLQTNAKANPTLSNRVEFALNSAKVESSLGPGPITLKTSQQLKINKTTYNHGSHGSHGSHVSHHSSHY